MIYLPSPCVIMKGYLQKHMIECWNFPLFARTSYLPVICSVHDVPGEKSSTQLGGVASRISVPGFRLVPHIFLTCLTPKSEENHRNHPPDCSEPGLTWLIGKFWLMRTPRSHLLSTSLCENPGLWSLLAGLRWFGSHWCENSGHPGGIL